MIFKPSICLTNGQEVISIIGKFTNKRLDVNKPIVKLMKDQDNTLLKWVFHKDVINSFSLTSIRNGFLVEQTVINLTNPSLTNLFNFSLDISCDSSSFYVTLNSHYTASLPYNSSELNATRELLFLGGFSVVKAGYIGQVKKLT